MQEDVKLYWSNFRTGAYDYRAFPETDEEARQDISQDPAAQGMYTVLRKMGRSIAEGLLEVLKATIGEK